MINPQQYGISFSLKQCRNFGIDPHETLDWLLAQGWRRFRLMSYWDEHEKQPGQYDFTELDWQIARIADVGGTISLCLGVKQPRWPEYHWPQWAWDLDKSGRSVSLVSYVSEVVYRYKEHGGVSSWQLENEALLQGFGNRIDIDRKRLFAEYQTIRTIDKSRPIIMSTSNGWGVPFRRPLPNIVGFSYYLKMYKNGSYHTTVQSVWLHRLRRSVIRIVLGKQVFIHELQCEPWGPEPIWKMSNEEQDQSMNAKQIAININAAERIHVSPIDLWGAEWWYWRYRQSDSSIWDAIRKNLLSD